jgi:hypothetical protein
LPDWSYASSPLDLDGDGKEDIQYAATNANVQSVMSEITNLASADDHLFFFVIDHGGSIDHVSNSYICLWGNERLQDTSLGSMIERLTNKQVTVNMVLGQCYSGGFIDNLNFPGCVVSTACTGSESSWACKEIPFDEFVYQWTCAINSSTPTGLRIEADDDGNNNITMKEAFDYAKAHDSTNETPQYFSMPESVGEDLAFNHLVPSYDLYIKDNYDDTGKEPNLTTFGTAPQYGSATNLTLLNNLKIPNILLTIF